jgi:predicted phosphodiesterase
MKILIISDLHGNADSLGALHESYDELWVLGDLVNDGPDPRAVVQAVRERATLGVRGNHDHAVGHGVDPRCALSFRAMAAATQRYAMEILAEEDKAYLRELPLTQAVVRDERRFFLCHATPYPLFGYCPPESPDWPREIDAIDADVILVTRRSEPVSDPHVAIEDTSERSGAQVGAHQRVMTPSGFGLPAPEAVQPPGDVFEGRTDARWSNRSGALPVVISARQNDVARVHVAVTGLAFTM